MPAQRLKSTKARAGFAVGDHVLVRFGPSSTVPAEIMEYRGQFGADRQHVFRVRTRDPSLDEQTSFEMWADALVHDRGEPVIS